MDQLASLEQAVNEVHSDFQRQLEGSNSGQKSKRVFPASPKSLLQVNSVSNTISVVDTLEESLQNFTIKHSMQAKKLFFDATGKPIPDNVIQAMKVAIAHQKMQCVRIQDTDQVRELQRNEVVPSYRNLQNLIHQCLLQMTEIKT